MGLNRAAGLFGRAIGRATVKATTSTAKTFASGIKTGVKGSPGLLKNAAGLVHWAAENPIGASAIAVGAAGLAGYGSTRQQSHIRGSSQVVDMPNSIAKPNQYDLGARGDLVFALAKQ